MAEPMDEDLPETPSLIESDLTCPVCKSLFLDPVIISCSHSFCQDCLNRCWTQKGKRECPICRKCCDEEQPIPNRHLKNTCESYQKEKRWRVSTKPEIICGLHHRDLEMFCQKDEVLICVECVALHRGHELFHLGQGAPICKEELNMKIKILADKLNSFKRTKRQFGDTVSFIQSQTEEAEQQIKLEFQRLHQFLNDEEESRILALRREEEQKRHMMKERIDRLTHDIASLAKLIESVKREMGAEDLAFLQNFKALKQK